MTQRGKTAVKVHPGQLSLEFQPFHTGNRLATRIETDLQISANNQELERQRVIDKAKNAAEAGSPDGKVNIFGQPVEKRRVIRLAPPKNRHFGKVEKVELGTVGEAAGELNRALARFSNGWLNLAYSTVSLEQWKTGVVEGELLDQKNRAFICNDFGVLRKMVQFVDGVRGNERDVGDEFEKLNGCSSWAASISRLMPAYWLLLDVGVKPFLEHAASLRVQRSARRGNGKAQPSEGEKRARNDEHYLEALGIVREFAGADWKRKPEPHPKMKRLVELVLEKVRAGERVLIYCAIGGSGISYRADRERKLAIEMKEAIEAGLGKRDAKVVIAAAERRIPEGDVVISRSFFEFAAVDRANPKIGLIIYYGLNNSAERSRAYGGRELYPAPAVTLVSSGNSGPGENRTHVFTV